MIEIHHKSLAEGRWFTMPLIEQLGNIGSEVNRAILARGDQKKYENAIYRALELFDLTLSDPRWRKQPCLKEIARARELFCAASYGVSEYKTSLEDLNTYFYYFAFAAQSERLKARQKTSS